MCILRLGDILTLVKLYINNSRFYQKQRKKKIISRRRERCRGASEAWWCSDSTWCKPTSRTSGDILFSFIWSHSEEIFISFPIVAGGRAGPEHVARAIPLPRAAGPHLILIYFCQTKPANCASKSDKIEAQKHPQSQEHRALWSVCFCAKNQQDLHLKNLGLLLIWQFNISKSKQDFCVEVNFCWVRQESLVSLTLPSQAYLCPAAINYSQSALFSSIISRIYFPPKLRSHSFGVDVE